MHSKTVIVLAGMPGAGKSLASTVAGKMGVQVYVSGDVIRDEARKLRLRPTRKNLGQLMIQIRKNEGMGAVAKRIQPTIRQSRSRFVLYEGARSAEEIDELRKLNKVVVVAIHASPRSRYRRLLRRKREDRPMTWSQFLERDLRELEVGLGKVVALADRTIENEGTKSDLRRQTRRVLTQIIRVQKK